jgi:hypothetical protein
VVSEARSLDRRRGRLAGRLVLVVVSLLVALGLAEIGARLVPPPASTLGDDGTDPNDDLWSDPDWRSPPPRTFRADPVLLFDNAPSQVADVPIGEHAGGRYRYRTNGYGLRRDAEIAMTPAPGTFRVLMLGDSQTGGYVNNAESFTQLLEDRWQSRARASAVEALNAGVIGYAPQQEYLWYLERGRPLRPDLVVLSLYVGNDVRDLVDAEVDAAVIEEEAGLFGPLRFPGAWLSLHSRLAQLAYASARTLPIRGLVDGLGLRAPPTPLPVAVDALVRVLRECHGCWLQSLKQAVRARAEPDRFEQAYRRLELLLRLLDRHVTSDGGRLAVMVIPSKSQVEPEDERGGLQRSLRLLELGPDDAHYEDVARERILAAVRAADIALIDPLPELSRASRGGRVFYRRDWHLNVRGNQALAEILDAQLGALGLAPPELLAR